MSSGAPSLPVGWLLENGHEVRMELLMSILQKHTLITGTSGWGKTGFLLSIIVGLLLRPRCPGIVLIDPKGEAAEELRDRFLPALAAEGKVAIRPEQIVSIQPFGKYGVPLNPLCPIPGISTEVQANVCCNLLSTLVDGGFEARMTSILSWLLRVVIAAHGSLVDVQRLLVDEGYASVLAGRLQDEELRRYLLVILPSEPRTSIEALRSRLDWLLLLPAIRGMLAAPGCIRGSDLIEAPLVIIDLSGAPMGFQALTRFVGSLLFQLIVAAIFDRKVGPSTQPVLLVVDEWHQLAKILASDFEQVLSLARFKKIGLWLANQTLAQVSESSKVLAESLKTNIALHLAFRPNPADVRALSSLLPITGARIHPDYPDRLLTKSEEEKYLVNLLGSLPPRQALLANHVTGQADVIRTLDLPYEEARRRAEQLPEDILDRYVRGRLGVPVKDLIARGKATTEPLDAQPARQKAARATKGATKARRRTSAGRTKLVVPS